MPFAPWTGVKSTGYGVANSVFALAHYTRPRTILVDKNAKPDFFWLPMDQTLREVADRLADAQLGKLWRAIAVPFLMSKRVKALRAFVRGGARAGESAAIPVVDVASVAGVEQPAVVSSTPVPANGAHHERR